MAEAMGTMKYGKFLSTVSFSSCVRQVLQKGNGSGKRLGMVNDSLLGLKP
jgi:hypothetical protein